MNQREKVKMKYDTHEVIKDSFENYGYLILHAQMPDNINKNREFIQNLKDNFIKHETLAPSGTTWGKIKLIGPYCMIKKFIKEQWGYGENVIGLFIRTDNRR